MVLAAIVFLILLLLGVSVAFSLGLAGMAFFLTTDLPMNIMVQNIVSPTQTHTLLAIPLFVFAGNLMNSTGITTRLISFAGTLTGHMHGHLGQVSAVQSTMMGGVSGSANADAAMQSRILGPQMIARGYSRDYAAAINGVTALITATIPPSMGLIIFGSVGEVSIGRLFAAGFVPGALMMLALMLVIRWTAKRRGYVPDRSRRAGVAEVGRAFMPAFWALMFPVLLVVGIRFGVFTPSESGAFACIYALFVGVVIYRELTWSRFIETVRSTVRDIGVIMILVAMSGAIAYGVVYEQVPAVMSSFLTDVAANKYILLLLSLGLVLVLAMFIETTVIALIMTPILLPVVTAAGVDPVHFGILMMTVTTMGIMTPPVGIALYTTASLLGTTPEKTARASLPFLGSVVGVVVLLVLAEDLVLFIPRLLYGEW